MKLRATETEETINSSMLINRNEDRCPTINTMESHEDKYLHNKQTNKQENTLFLGFVLIYCRFDVTNSPNLSV